MSSAFLSTPMGFHSSLELLNGYPADVITSMTYDIAAGSPAAALGVKYAKRLAAAAAAAASASSSAADTPVVTPAQVAGALHAIAFVLRSAKHDKLASPDALIPALLQHTSLTPNTAGVLAAAVLSPATPIAAASAAAAGFSLGQVVGFDWKVGVGLASSECANLKAPFISVVWKIGPSINHTKSWIYECNLLQQR